MKKYLALALGVIFTLGFAASAFAIHAEIPAETQAVVAKGGTQITLGGELRFRGEIKNNTDLDKNSGVGENTDTSSAYNGRVRLRIEAKVSKNTMGVIHLESGDSNGSATNTDDIYTWGAQGGEGKGTYPQGNSKKGSMEILEAWIQHTFTSIPVGIKVGHMPLALGNKLFFNHSKLGDDAIMIFANPIKELTVALLTIKLNEYAFGTTASTNSADDTDAYVALFAYSPSKGTSISGDVTYVDDKRAYMDSTGHAALFGGPNDKGTHIANYGLRANTEVGGLGVKGDIEIQNGTTKFDSASGKSSIKDKGYAYLLGVSYNANPVKLSLDYVYGSGDDNSTDNKNSSFVTALSGGQNYTYVHDYRAAGATGTAGTGISNTRYIKLGANADLTKDLNADLNFYRLDAAQKNLAYRSTTSKKIGNELDAKITYKIDKNLVYFVEGGYLWTGTFYDTTTVTADDAYAVRHGITLSF